MARPGVKIDGLEDIPRVPLAELVPLQGPLKDLEEAEFKALRRSILEEGFFVPMFYWEDPEGTKNLIDGHQRLRVLQALHADGFSIPDVPAVRITASDLDDAKKRLLLVTSQFGRMQRDGLYEFISSIRNFDPKTISTDFRFPEIDAPVFVAEFFRDLPGSASDDEAISLYTKNIKAPVYEPKGEKPNADDLCDTTKTFELLEEIEAADGVPEDVKSFLRLAAQRHTVFNYERIAEFYAHADAKAQALMEKSALVIIDFDKAIENGFVAMTREIAETYPSDAE